MTEKTILYTCSNMAAEIRALISRSSLPRIEVREFPMICGLQPARQRHLTVPEHDRAANRVLIIGGPCLRSAAVSDGIHIVLKDQCFNYFLFGGVVDYFQQQGCYLLTPGWLENWEKHLRLAGFDRRTAGEFFRESCSRLLLLDTGVYRGSAGKLSQLAEYLDLPADSVITGTDLMKTELETALAPPPSEDDRAVTDVSDYRKQMTDYAMALDIVSSLSVSRSEKEVIEQILMLFDMLFAPQVLHYLSVTEKGTARLFSRSGLEFSDPDIASRMRAVNEKYAWHDSGSGFTIQVAFHGTLLGVVETGEIAFPHYRDHYLNLALFLSDICGLAAANARYHQTITEQTHQLKTSLDELQRSQAMLTRTGQLADVGGWEIDQHTKRFYITSETAAILGVPAGTAFTLQEAAALFPRAGRLRLFTHLKKALQQGLAFDLETAAGHPEAENIWVRIVCSPEFSEGRVVRLSGAVQNITRKKHAEMQIKKDLAEKEVLLREVNHRVKNNMTVISSLLNLQSSGLTDPRALAALEESRNRIRTMALIHEKLYKSANLAEVAFSQYVEDLCSYLFTSYNTAPERIRLQLEITDVNLDVGKGIPCALIINELISNCLEHAFPQGREGTITVYMAAEYGRCTLRVADDGIGRTAAEGAAAASLGTELVRLFTEQLEGTLHLSSESGTETEIIFPL